MPPNEILARIPIRSTALTNAFNYCEYYFRSRTT
ncbi:unnamed protein product, partial [Heterotrigona itama]